MTEQLGDAKRDESLKDLKLKIAGGSYLLGDGLMYAAAQARGEKLVGNKLGAASWAVGGVAATVYGNPDSERKLAMQARRLEQHFRQHGIEIPASAREQNLLLKSPTFWDRFTDFLYQHPSELLNAGFAIGAGTLLKGAVPTLGKTHSLLGTGGRKISTDFWIGATVMTGALGGLLIKEDPNAREKAKDGTTLEKAVAWIQEKPLRFSSAFYTANNAFLAGKVVQDYQVRGAHGAFKPHYFSGMQLATYLFGNAMLMMSRRDQYEGQTMKAEDLAKLEDASARIIAAQPPEVQQALLSDISHYLAAEKNVGQEPPQIAQALANRISELTQQRMQQVADNVSWTAREAARAQHSQDNEIS